MRGSSTAPDRRRRTWLFDDDEKMYRELEDVYRFFFDDEPPAPGHTPGAGNE